MKHLAIKWVRRPDLERLERMRMLLAVDIGNTNVSCAIFRRDKIVRRFFIPTQDYSRDKIKKGLGRSVITEAIICSVVPAVSGRIARDLKIVLGVKPYIIGKDIRVPIRNLYRRPGEVGQDRLVNAYTGVKFYGTPLIAVDFGTAVTFDVISKEGGYLGGMILPGLRISLESLAEKTALLPRTKLQRPDEFIGRDTRSSMLSGIVYGLAALSDELVVRIKKKIGRNAKVIATGGDVKLISRYCRQLDKTDSDLIFKGLNLIAKSAIK